MLINKKKKIEIGSLVLSILFLFSAFTGIGAKASASSNADLVSITVNGQRISMLYSGIISYDLELPANTPDEMLTVIGEPKDLTSIVSIEGDRLVNKSALVKITVTAENKSTQKTYYINVTLRETSLSGSFTDIKTADFHSLALRNDGTLYGFGENDFGQLGDSTIEPRNKPVQVKGIANVVDFDTSNSHSAAVTNDGSVWVWGLNDYGQLNAQNKLDVLTPIKVNGLQDIIKVRTGNRFSIALDKNGLVWFWGYNYKGQLEDEASTGVGKPEIISQLRGIDVKDIETGDFHSLALTEDGEVYAWGANDYGQLGEGTTNNKYSPVKVDQLSSIKFINAKGNTSSCISEDGTAFIWGETNYLSGQLIVVPTEVQEINDTFTIEATSNNIVQLRVNGQVNAFGNNDYGQLGNGGYYSRSYFSSVYGTGKARKISTSPYNIFIIGEDGNIYAAGRNESGQLGTGVAGQSVSTIQKIPELGDTPIERVYADKSSGEVSLNTTIKLATSTLNSKIYYTLDGSTPSEKSILYTNPIPVTQYTIIKAVAVKGGKYSAVSTFQYIINNSASEMNVTIGTKTAVSGSVIEIPITFSNVPQTGISNLKFALQFNPEILSLSDVVPGDIVARSGDFSYSKTLDGKVIISFTDSTKISNNIIKGGTFAVLKMYLRSSNSLGKYPITQIFTSGEGFYSRYYKKYDVKYNQGYVNTDLLYGDVDGDQKITSLDLQYVQRYVLNKLYYFPGSKGREAADVNKDGAIDSKDVELIKNLILKGE